MLTWINEKAKWIIVIFAAGIAVGLLAMDRVPNQGKSYPVGEVGDKKISYSEFDSQIKMIVQSRFQGQHLEDEQYNQLRAEVFRGFVRQILVGNIFEKAQLSASVAEIQSEFARNGQDVRANLVQEAQRRLYSIQQQATSQEDLTQRTQAFIASLPSFMTDSTAGEAEYEAWLKTPEAFRNWGSMLQIEQNLETNGVPMLQLQTLVGASVHATSLEANWNVERRMTDYELLVASASASDFAVDASTIDTAAVKDYYNAHKDSFFVARDAAQFVYAYLPIAATAQDEARIADYAKTIYEQVTDPSATTSFEDLARVSSEDPGTAENGGVLEQEAGRGIFVPEFEKAALALDSGAISQPIRSAFGFHIIKCYSKSKDSTGAEFAKVGHILLKVDASSETVDSLEAVLTGIKSDVDAGKTFEAAAKERNLEVMTSNWLARNENIEGMGYLKGLGAYAWPNEILPEDASKVSPVMKNAKWVVVAQKIADVKAGVRSYPLFFNSIQSTLANNKASAAAEAYLNSVAAQVKTWNPADTAAKVEIEKVKLESKTASVDGYVPGFGYGSVEFAKAVKNAKEGEWTSAVATANGAVMFKVVSKKAPEAEALNIAAKTDIVNMTNYGAKSSVNDFVSNIEAATPVVNNLDLYYRD